MVHVAIDITIYIYIYTSFNFTLGLSAADEDFERDHDRTLADGLLAQVGEMKELAIDIGSEVRSHNRFLEGMDEGTF